MLVARSKGSLLRLWTDVVGYSRQIEAAIFEQSLNQVPLLISALYLSSSRFHSSTPLFHDPSDTAGP